MGLIGCGVMGRSLAESAAEVPAASMAWVSDVDEEKGSALSTDLSCGFHLDYREAIALGGADAVIIATPRVSSRRAGAGSGGGGSSHFFGEAARANSRSV